MPIREFTELEDDIIKRYASGDLVIRVRELEKLLKRMWPTIEARATNLGVKIVRKKRSPPLHRAGPSDTMESVNFFPYSCTVGEDELLARLHLLHPDRAARYG